jgi:hypothetical protein
VAYLVEVTGLEPVTLLPVGNCSSSSEKIKTTPHFVKSFVVEVTGLEPVTLLPVGNCSHSSKRKKKTT